jgi:predicted DNA-binding helix-hairpin-helix protein
MYGLRKLDIRADAAKYDAACTSSGTELQDSRNKADRSSFSETTGHSLTAGARGACRTVQAETTATRDRLF